MHCDFLTSSLTCTLSEYTMDMMLKVRMRLGKHTFREDVYRRTLKYRRWNNELRPFQSLKRRVANMFWKRNSLSDDSRGTSTQTIMNNIENNDEENRSVATDNDSDKAIMHSNWSKLIAVNEEAEYSKLKGEINVNASTFNASVGEAVKTAIAQPRKRAVKNIVLVPYKPKPTEWGSWKIKSPYVTSTIASSFLVPNEQDQSNKMVYVPNSPYYPPLHPSEFYGDE